MFGYACRETEPLMPAPIFYAHRILHEMAKARHTGRTPELGPDAKSQVTLAYEDGKPVRADSIVVSTQHGEDVSQERVKEIVRGFVDEVMPKGWVNGYDQILRQPDRPLRDRRTRRRCRRHRAQDHRRHLWRRGAAWRRRLLRQGPDQGRPLGRLCRALSRQERRGGGARRPMHAATLLRHRRVAAALALCRSARHGQHRRGSSSRRRCGRSWI